MTVIGMIGCGSWGSNWVRTLVWTANALFLLVLTGYLLGVTW